MTNKTEVTEQPDVVVEVKPTLNLYQKIQAVMKDVDYLQKDGKIEFKSTKYKAISEEKVTSAVRKSLIDHGLVILPIDQFHTREGSLTTVDTKYKIVDIDTGQYEVIVSSGTGADTQDKGVGKAMTYSYKYLLLRTFAIPTGEDPDKISSAELDEKIGNQEGGEKKSVSSGNGSIKLASEKQLNLVTNLLKQKVNDKWSYDALYEKLKEQIGTERDIENWTGTEASKAITVLQHKVDKKGA